MNSELWKLWTPRPVPPPPEPEAPREDVPEVFTWLGEHCGRKGHRRYDDTAVDERYADEWGATA